MSPSSLPRGLAVVVLVCPLLALGAPSTLGAPVDDVSTLLRLRIEAARDGSAGTPLQVGRTRLRAGELIVRHYRETGFEPGWIAPSGPTSLVDSLVAALRDADTDGLHPDDYHASAIDSLRRHLSARADAGEPVSARTLADLELLCTDAFLLYGSHLQSGRVDPASLIPTWTLDQRQSDLVQHLQRVLDTGRPRPVLDRLRPPQPAYDTLRRALARYRRLAETGGWPSVPEGPTLKEGVRDARVPVLRQRLRATGDLSATSPPTDSLRYDDTLRQAVSRFQERHGLDIDGAVGPSTRAALNVPVDARLRQIRINLERWRWLPQDLGDPHVLVNIADYWLRVVEGEATVLQMRVVVGTRFRQTPVFSDRISYLVFSPYWHVPHRIAVEDKLPEFQRDPSLVSRLGFEVFRGWGSDAAAVDPSTIAWDSLSAAQFPYRLRQRPGPANALGRVKFMFPNRHNVYLHDTPSRGLFSRTQRSFSSGCIRVEYPAELAAYLLRENDGWSPERVRDAMAGDAERIVPLRRTVPVHLLYWTAWAEDGTIHFRPDVYERDDAVASALAAPPAAPSPRSSAIPENR